MPVTCECNNADAGGIPSHDFDSYRVDDVDGLCRQEACRYLRQLEKGTVRPECYGRQASCRELTPLPTSTMQSEAVR